MGNETSVPNDSDSNDGHNTRADDCGADDSKRGGEPTQDQLECGSSTFQEDGDGGRGQLREDQTKRSSLIQNENHIVHREVGRGISILQSPKISNAANKTRKDVESQVGHIDPSNEISAQVSYAATAANAPPGTRTALDDDTLDCIRNYLTSKEFEKDTLEEDEVAMFSVKTSRYANERTRYRQNLLEDSGMAEGETFYDRVYREEEFFALANEFFKTVVAEAQAAAGPNFNIHNKTVNWVKRAAGLQRPYDPLEQTSFLSDSDEAVEQDSNETAPRRLTRGMARNTRVKRREERRRKQTEGIRILQEVAEEVVKARRMSSTKTKKTTNKKNRRQPIHSSEKPRKTAATASDYASQPSPSAGRSLVATIPASLWRGRGHASDKRKFVDVKVSRVIVYGRHVSGATEEELLEWRRERKRRQNREYYLQRKAAKLRRATSPSGAAPEEGNVRKRRALDRITPSAHTTVGGGAQRPSAKLDEYTLLASMYGRNYEPSATNPQTDGRVQTLDLSAARSLMQKWDLEDRQARTTSAVRPLELHRHGPRRHKDNFYAQSCKKVLNFMHGKGMNWVMNEFFYSDIDKGWYAHNDMVSDIVKLGLSPDVKLTRREWKFVRQNIRRKPRRFSESFIASQLRRRNRFRSLLRLNRRNLLVGGDKLPYLSLPIKAGTVVAVRTEHMRAIHRGRVLFYDATENGYYIQFGNGCTFCPDTEVAAYGAYEFPVYESDSPAAEPGFGEFQCPTALSGLSPYGTIKHRASTSRGSSEYKSARENGSVPPVDPPAPTMATSDNVDVNITTEQERNVLTTLVSLVEAGLERKARILSALGEFTTLHNTKLWLDRYPTAVRSQVMTESHSQESWLVSNLQATSRSLEKAMGYVRVLFGTASPGPTRFPNQQPTGKKGRNDGASILGRHPLGLAVHAVDETFRKLMEDASKFDSILLSASSTGEDVQSGLQEELLSELSDAIDNLAVEVSGPKLHS